MESDSQVTAVSINRVQRRLKYDSGSLGSIESTCDDLMELAGVHTVSVGQADGLLTVDYDAVLCGIDPIISILTKNGVDLCLGRWDRIKLGYYRFVDQNLKENNKHTPHCCNRVSRR
jgi:hypothetical protein